MSGRNEEWSPEDLWDGLDPRREDLEVEVLGRTATGSAIVQELRFHSHTWEGEPVTAYGFLGLPAVGDGLPGVLHIHGGGQAPSADHVRRWGSQGYAALSVDWTGPAPGRARHTDFGAVPTTIYLTEPDPRFSHLYHAIVVARRGLTLLERHERVDPRRLGIYGISWGGFLAWLMNGTDRRVRAAVAVYGCGGTLKRGSRGGGDFDPGNTNQRTWTFCYSPFEYADLQKSPMLFLNCTNDFFGWMDTAEELLAILPKRHRACFCPHYDHHIDERTSRNLYAWMDVHLNSGLAWPKPPRLRLHAGRSLRLTVVPDTPDDVEALEVLCSVNHVPPPCRFWNHVEVRRNGGRWHGEIPVVLPKVPETVVATAHYRRGISVSSIPRTFVPGDLGDYGGVAVPQAGIDGLAAGGTRAWYLNGLTTEPFPVGVSVRETEWDGERALTLDTAGVSGKQVTWALATRRLAHPNHAGQGWSALRLVLELSVSGSLTVRLTRRSGLSDAESYAAAMDGLTAGLHDLTLAPGRFVGTDGMALPDFGEVVLLEILGASPKDRPPVVIRVEWS